MKFSLFASLVLLGHNVNKSKVSNVRVFYDFVPFDYNIPFVVCFYKFFPTQSSTHWNYTTLLACELE